MDFDLESLVNVEQTFYDDGYKDGYAHGRIHGLIEGRALGREKGFEMWEELGFYEGFALLWKAVSEKRGISDDRVGHHIKHLLNSIEQFPRVNPSTTEHSELDIPKLFRQIRSRYKALCAALGIRSTMRAGSVPPPQGAVDESGDGSQESQPNGRKKKIWNIDGSGKPPGGGDLSF